jgi:hypothetical protein
MNIKKILFLVCFVWMSSFFNGCYSDAINSVDKISVQVPADFFMLRQNFDITDDSQSKFYTDYESINVYSPGNVLYGLKEYQENKDKLISIEIYQMTGWIDEISNYQMGEDGKFQYISVYFEFYDGSKFTVFNLENPYLREFYNKDVQYFKPNIYNMSSGDMGAMSKKIIAGESFRVLAYLKNYTGPRTFIDRLSFRISASIRLTIKL